MATPYKAPLADQRFALFDLLEAEKLYQRLGFENASRETCDAVLEEAARFTETVLAPLNSVGDAHGCEYDKATGDVRTAPGFKEAYAAFAEAGWAGLTGPESAGGQNMPESLGAAVKEMLDASNLAWSNFSLL
jgi:alkylation response protein AidB-like acyl-CoA dehydrogenase